VSSYSRHCNLAASLASMSLFYSLSAARLASFALEQRGHTFSADLRRCLGLPAHQRVTAHSPCHKINGTACLSACLHVSVSLSCRLCLSQCLSVCLSAGAAVDVLLIYSARDINAPNTCTSPARGDRPQRLREIAAAKKRRTYDRRAAFRRPDEALRRPVS